MHTIEDIQIEIIYIQNTNKFKIPTKLIQWYTLYKQAKNIIKTLPYIELTHVKRNTIFEFHSKYMSASVIECSSVACITELLEDKIF